MKKSAKSILRIAVATSLGAIIITSLLVFSPYIYFPGYKEYDKADYKTDKVTIYSEGDKEVFDAKSKIRLASIDDMPKYVYGAFVSVEDKRFFDHEGIDVKRVASALVKDVFGGRIKEGGSTITQQLVKNVALSSDKSIKRKINEIKLAQRVEADYTKKEILEKYLNSIYYGNGVYGIADAAAYYFDKTPSSVLPEEAATLAAIINNPSAYDPIKNAENCVKRRNLILKMMNEQGYIDDKQYLNAENSRLNISATGFYDHYAAAVIGEAKEELDLSSTTLTSNEDEKTKKRVEEIIKKENTEGYVTVIVAKNGSGKVLARVSSFPYDISTSRFMPGSIVKPLLCYAPLLESGKIYTCSPITDEKTDFDGYSPSNYAEKYEGIITQSRALAISSNVAAIKNFVSYGPRNAVAFASKAGLNFDEIDYENYATALGALKYGLTLDEIMSIYLCIASSGKRVTPSYLNCAVKNDETVVIRRQENYNVMREDTAYLLTSMMRECANSGTAKTLKSFQNVCAKTGTVGDKDGNSECYCVAYSPSYTVLCHISKKNKPLPLSYTGGTRPAKIVKKVFEFLHDVEEFTPPESVVKCDIDLNEWKKGNVILANDFEVEKNKKSYWFSRRYLPPKSNSYDVFFDKYLRDLNDLDRIYGFADKRVEIGNLGKF